MKFELLIKTKILENILLVFEPSDVVLILLINFQNANKRFMSRINFMLS